MTDHTPPQELAADGNLADSIRKVLRQDGVIEAHAARWAVAAAQAAADYYEPKLAWRAFMEVAEMETTKRAEAAEARVRAALELHVEGSARRFNLRTRSYEPVAVCTEDGYRWPCDTRVALGADEPNGDEQ